LPFPSRAGYAPLTIMTGLPAQNPVIHIFYPDANGFVRSPITVDRLKEHMIGIRDSLEQMHKRVANTRSK